MTDPSDDTLSFGEEDGALPPDRTHPPWHVLVVDDEPDVHRVTRLALAKVRFKERGLVFVDAYSADEARALLAERSDIAVILLDVVMESEDAGLQLARWIRNDLGNRQVRIILRTGQPGQAPEREVILDYDINDYKCKAELTAERLFTSVIAALRGYDDLMTIEVSRRGLEKIVAVADKLNERASLASFASGVLTQIGALLELPVEGILLLQHEPERCDPDAFAVLACTGRFASLDSTARCCLDDLPVALEPLRRAMAVQGTVVVEQAIVLYLGGMDGEDLIAWVEPNRRLSDDELRLLRVFAKKLVLSFRNALLYERLRAHNRQLEQRVAERTRALAESNAELHRLATTDSLTGLANRHSVFERAQQALDKHRLGGGPCAAALLDIDRFKRINDLWGHQIGDEVLTQFALRLLSGIRDSDIAGRVGGEELLLILPGVDLQSAARMLERLRLEIATLPFATTAGPIAVTASFGVTAMRPDDPDFRQAYRRADEALYRAKGAGRNRIETG